MKVHAAEFLRSATGPHEGAGWPEEGPPEVAFVGRSNVGKSTLLQALTQRRGLVRTSSTPGRTRLINFFALSIEPAPGRTLALRFVDLPGFGYAQVSKDERAKWIHFIDEYLGGRPSLRVVVFLVDARREVGRDETELIKYAAERGIRVLAAVTKTDKLSKHERKPIVARLRGAIGVPTYAVSATEGDGLGELWRGITVALGEPGA